MATRRKSKRKLMKRGAKNLRRFVRSIAKKNPRSRRKNPVRVAATVTGSGTGWIKAKAVRVVRGKGGATKVEVKR